MYLSELSWKREYILEVSHFLYEIICCKLPQHPRGVFPWHLEACRSSVYMIYLTMFWYRVISTKWRKKLLIHNINLTGHKNAHVAYYSWFSWRHESLLCFGIGDPRFFLRVAPTMISNRFVKLSIMKYYTVWSKRD